MKAQQFAVARIVPLASGDTTSRRLPPLRWPAWADRAAEHPRACWTVAAACTAAALLLLVVMATGGLYPVTDWNGPRGLKPGHAAPTVAAGRAH